MWTPGIAPCSMTNVNVGDGSAEGAVVPAEAATPRREEIPDVTRDELDEQLARAIFPHAQEIAAADKNARQVALHETCAIGELVLDRIAKGRMEVFRMRTRQGTPLRQVTRILLAMGCKYGATTLWNSVHVYDVATRLRLVQTSEHIAPSHVVAVLGLPEPEQAKFLGQAESEELSVRELRARVRVGSSVGRERALEDLLHQMGKVADAAQAAIARSAATLHQAKRRELFTSVVALRGTLDEIQQALGLKPGEVDGSGGHDSGSSSARSKGAHRVAPH